MLPPRTLKRRDFTAGLVSAAALTALAPSLAFAQDAGADAGKFISTFAQAGIVEILTASIPPAEKQRRFREMFKRDFDIPAIGKFVLGRFSRGVAPTDQQSFDTLFEDVIVYTWSRRFSEYNGQTLKVIGTGPDGAEGALVKSTVVGKGGDSFNVDWRLRKQQDVVGEVHHRGARGHKISIRRGFQKRLQDDRVVAPFDAHRSTVHGPAGVDAGDDRFDDHGPSRPHSRPTSAR